MCVLVCSYLAARHDPVGNSQEGQADGDPQHCPALHPDGLLPQTRKVLVPDSQQLLLTVRMGNKLQREWNRRITQMERKGREDGDREQRR